MLQKPSALIVQPNGHAKYAPSSAYRWMECTRSIQHCEGIPDPEETEAAKRGTLAHEYGERVLKGQKVVLSKYPKDMRDQVNGYVKYVHGEFFMYGYEELLVETKVSLAWIHPELGGTTDAALVKLYDSLHMVDYKNGVGYVAAHGNKQLLTYLLGLAHQYHYDFLDYHGTIYQPNYKGRNPRTYSMRTNRLRAHEEDLKRAIDLCEGPKAKFKYGDWCFFCKGKDTCPEYEKKQLASATSDFDNLSAFDEVEIEEVTD